jgi:hypothetical protein
MRTSKQNLIVEIRDPMSQVKRDFFRRRRRCR